MTNERPSVQLNERYSVFATCEHLKIHRNTLRRYEERCLINPSFHPSGLKFFFGSEILRFWEDTL